MKGLPAICPECRKRFRTKSGLEWHLFHIHKWADTRKILATPSLSQLAKLAVEDEVLLAAFAKGLEMDIEALKALIKQRFGKEAE